MERVLGGRASAGRASAGGGVGRFSDGEGICGPLTCTGGDTESPPISSVGGSRRGLKKLLKDGIRLRNENPGSHPRRGVAGETDDCDAYGLSLSLSAAARALASASVWVTSSGRRRRVMPC